MTRPLRIQARLSTAPEPPFDRFHDPIVDDVVRGGEVARLRFATRWSETDTLSALARVKRRPLSRELADELVQYHRRLGASAASLAAIEKLRRGEAVCAVAGQQPAPLGGPLYSLHKTAAAAGLAAEVERRLETPCVPLFWMHGEDSDFAEIRTAWIADGALVVQELHLASSVHPEGGLVGEIPVDPVKEVSARALEHWKDHAARADAEALLQRSLAAARDLGEAQSALMLALFAERGLVVVDPRLPSFRAAARPIIDRYLEHAEELADRARRAGDFLEQRFGRRPLAGPALDSFVFAIEDGTRRKLTVDEARAFPPDRPLSPSVALRPALQDGVFPTVAMSCGAAEVAYLAQLREVFEGVGVPPACPVPRLSATWLPGAALELLEISRASEAEVILATDQVLKHLAEREVPDDAREALERSRRDASESLASFAEQARRVDQSLPQMVDSARSKVDYQYARLAEGLAGKVRHRLERQHPEWPRLRYFLMPGERLQERRLASLEVVAHRGARVALELCELAEEHARGLERGVHEHYVLLL